MNVFFDASALAKPYVEEAGRDRVQEILSSAPSLAISVLCIPEIVSALCRRRRERKLSHQQYLATKKALFADVEDMSVVNLTDQVIARTVEILEKGSLRSSDSMHIASAAEWSSQLFVSAYERQCAAARDYGLPVGIICLIERRTIPERQLMTCS